MNILIKDVIKDIHGLDIRKDTGKIRVRAYSDGAEYCRGHAKILSEALMLLKGDHWITSEDKDKDKEDNVPFGFIYRIVDTKSKKGYIGRKQTIYYDKASHSYSVPSGWESYIGSCAPLKIEYDERPQDFLFYRILDCNNRDELGYAEHQLISSIFHNRLVTGELEYYNNVIPKLFRGQLDGVDSGFMDEVEEIKCGI